MAMSADTLAAKLKEIPNTEDEAEVTEGWKEAFDFYFAESEVKTVSPLVIPGDPGDPEAEPPIPPTPRSTPYDAALAQLKSAMVGISTTGPATQGATKIHTAITAFWTALAPIVSTVWVVVPPLASLVTPPPGLLAGPAYIAALAAIFTANQVGALSASDCYDAIATHVHTNNLQAQVVDTTAPTPVVLPIT